MNVQCEVCGNYYAKGFTIFDGNAEHQYDCFECAIEGTAPRCDHCGCRIIGHGIEDGDHLYCCSHCVRQASGTPSEIPT